MKKKAAKKKLLVSLCVILAVILRMTFEGSYIVLGAVRQSKAENEAELTGHDLSHRNLLLTPIR